ncbi:hypothetical protein D9M68_664340 [compost metagenome]
MGAGIPQRLHDGDRRTVAHVVGVRLEGEAEDRDLVPAHVAAGSRNHLAAHCPLAVVVDRNRGLDEPDGRVMVLRGLDQCQRVLREARAAIAGARMQELRADAAIEADAAGDVLDIGADLFAEVGHLVDEGDLHRQEGIAGILDQFGGAA